MRSASTSLLGLLLLFGVLACGGSAGKFAPGSYERGSAEFDDEAYLDAIDDLKLFIRRNPTDDRADDAQLLIARAYMAKEDYPVAAVELEILRKDYPGSDLFDEAYYMQGLCYAEQVPRIELEQEVTQDAIDHFRRYLRDQPSGAFRKEAEAQVAELQLHLDEKLLSAARLYVRRGYWKAVDIYLDSFLQERPDSQLAPEALFLRARAQAKLGKAELAQELYRELTHRFPESPFASRAQNRILPASDSEEDG